MTPSHIGSLLLFLIVSLASNTILYPKEETLEEAVVARIETPKFRRDTKWETRSGLKEVCEYKQILRFPPLPYSYGGRGVVRERVSSVLSNDFFLRGEILLDRLGFGGRLSL